MIKPTVGRIVWYHPSIHDPHEWSLESPPPQQECPPLAAIITRVWSDSCVNLAVFAPSGETHPRTSVTLVSDGSVPGAYAEWMPYQKGQAAKAEAQEAAQQEGLTMTEAVEHKQEIIDTLLYARLALCATHNVKATDRPDLPMTDSTSWTTDHSKETEAIDHALTALGVDPRAPVEVKKPRWVVHASDCALHNGPAMEPGPCDCGAAIEQEIQAKSE